MASDKKSEASLKALCAIKEIPVQWKRVSKNPSKERLILAGEVCPMKLAYNRLTCEQQNILRDGVVLISAVEDLHRVCVDPTEFMKEGIDPRSAHYLFSKSNPYYSNGYARVSLKFRREDGLFGSVTFTPYYELAFNVKSEPANKFEFDNLDLAMAEFHTIVYGGVGRPPYFSDRLQVKCFKNTAECGFMHGFKKEDFDIGYISATHLRPDGPVSNIIEFGELEKIPKVWTDYVKKIQKMADETEFKSDKDFLKFREKANALKNGLTIVRNIMIQSMFFDSHFDASDYPSAINLGGKRTQCFYPETELDLPEGYEFPESIKYGINRALDAKRKEIYYSDLSTPIDKLLNDYDKTYKELVKKYTTPAKLAEYTYNAIFTDALGVECNDFKDKIKIIKNKNNEIFIYDGYYKDETIKIANCTLTDTGNVDKIFFVDPLEKYPMIEGESIDDYKWRYRFENEHSPLAFHRHLVEKSYISRSNIDDIIDGPKEVKEVYQAKHRTLDDGRVVYDLDL